MPITIGRSVLSIFLQNAKQLFKTAKSYRIDYHRPTIDEIRIRFLFVKSRLVLDKM